MPPARSSARSTGRSSALSASFWRLWTAGTISNAGDGISFVAMPLLALTLTDDPRQLALVTFAAYAPWIVLAIPIGVLVDRFEQRTLLITANLTRVPLLVAIAWGASAGRLTIVRLVVLLVLIGLGEVVFDSTAQAFVTALVEPQVLPRANGLLIAGQVVAGSLAGLAIGAVLFDAWVALPAIVDAATFLFAAVLIASIPAVRRATAPEPPARSSAAAATTREQASARWLWSHGSLRALAGLFAFTTFGLMFGQGVFAKFAVDELGLRAPEFGALMAISATGGATGGLVAERALARFGERATVAASYAVFALGNMAIGLAPIAWVVAASGFLVGVAVSLWNVVTVTLRQRLIPAARFGRVNAIYRWLGAVSAAAGVVVGGFVAHAWSLRAPYVVGGAATILGAVVFARPAFVGLSPRQGR